MKRLVLLGDEAIAQGALDAGLSAIYAYPGTPSTEIAEYIHSSKSARNSNIFCYWSANEKTAFEGALGMSYAGKRTMVCMKHVGLNVAADPFMNSAIVGANGGLIVVSADDPSMHSSQNEQDSRFFGKFAMVPTLEPSDQQEAYDMVRYGYEFSEKFKIPVLLRITTRLAHSRAGVDTSDARQPNDLKIPENLKQFILLPAMARKKYKVLLDNQKHFEKESETSGFNEFFEGKDKSLGVIVSGIAYNYLKENYQDEEIPYPVLKICQYPLPKKLIEKICSECKEILVIEEGYPMIEEQIRGLLGKGLKVKGRNDGSIPKDGELNPNIVAKAFGLKEEKLFEAPNSIVPRPPSLCGGCPHIDSYKALNDALENYSLGRTFSDIGCYTLGALEPFESINTCVDMGASITMAKGAADAGLVPSVAVIGDSTFTHSGITGLLDAVIYKSPVTVMILDNSTTAMTGGQPSAANNRLVEICKGLGVEEEHLKIISPLKKNHPENVAVIKKELAYDGVSVIIPQRECVVTLNKKTKEKRKK